MKWIHIKDDIFTCVSDVDFNQVLSGCLYINANGYVCISNTKKPILVHRLVLGEPPIEIDGERYVVDHINKNKLDNRRENLRHTKSHNNTINRSQKGIYEKEGKWVASICRNYKNCELGEFKTRDEAVACRKGALRVFEFFFKEINNESDPVEILLPTEKEKEVARKEKIISKIIRDKKTSENLSIAQKERYWKNPKPFGRHVTKNPNIS